MRPNRLPERGSTALYNSVRERLFGFPDETLVYPAHDYHGRMVSTVRQERERNSRLRDGISLGQFKKIMAGLDLPYPKKIDLAVPANIGAAIVLKQICTISTT